MLLNEGLFGEDVFESISQEGTWKDTYSFTYVAGTTVSVLINMVASIPLGTTIQIYAGEDEDSYVEVINGVETSVLFVSPYSGTASLYVKLVLKSSQSGLVPIVSSLAVTVYQMTSLYTIATNVLADGLLASNSEWCIDTELQKYLIPFAWFSLTKHRKALAVIAEACGGAVRQNRYGIVCVEAGNIYTRNTIQNNVFLIEDDRILDVESPISVIKNKIQIETRPYAALADQLLWEISTDKKIDSGESRTFNIKLSDFDAAIDMYSSISSVPSGATITSETFYSWGCLVTVLGSVDNQVLTLEIHGKPLSIVGSQIITESDGDSIRKNGEKTLSIKDNNLIQSNPIAELIGESTIVVTAKERRDILSTWRGDPSLEIGDEGFVNVERGVIVYQEFNYDGALECVSRIRRL